MKKIYFFLIAMLVALSAQAWTVSFKNTVNWDNVNVYAWDSNIPDNNWVTNAWPGSAMTQEGDVWTFTGEGNPTGLIFNNGKEQSNNLIFYEGGTYVNDGLCFTITFDNSKTNWSKVYAYIWNSNGVLQKWPGREMTKDGDNYVLTVEGFDPEKIIFHNNADAKTKDLPYIVNASYDVDGPVGFEAPVYAVYFDNSNAKWGKVYAHVWGNGHETVWPGEECKVDENTGYHYYSVKAFIAPEYVIFNDGQVDNKTGELKFVNDALYNEKGATGNTSGIENVSVEEAAVEYYTLQGVRVSEPVNGLYIRRQGNKLTKVIIR